MKKHLLVIFLLFSTIVSYSQSKSIVGSWLWRDSINAIQFFIHANGTVEKRTALASEDIWDKTPQIGTYTFKNDHSLVIKWADKSVENIDVKFVDNNAKFEIANQNGKPSKPRLFLRIVDEEIIPDK